MTTPDIGITAEDQALSRPFAIVTQTGSAVVLGSNGEVAVNWQEVEKMACVWESMAREPGSPITPVGMAAALCKVLESLRKGAIRDDMRSPPSRPIEHDEAHALAAMRSGQSNLARCYLDLRKTLAKVEALLVARREDSYSCGVLCADIQTLLAKDRT